MAKTKPTKDRAIKAVASLKDIAKQAGAKRIYAAANDIAQQYNAKVLAREVAGDRMKAFGRIGSSTEVRQCLADELNEAEAIANRYEEGGEMSSHDATQWEAIMDEKHGTASMLQSKLEQHEASESEKKTLALARRRNKEKGSNKMQSTISKPQVTNNLRAFKGENAKEDAYAAGMWLRSTVARAAGRRDERADDFLRTSGFHNTATEGTDTAGGHTVPDPLSAAFIQFRESVGVSRQVSDVRAMSADTLKVPKLTAGPTVQYPGEATAITPTDQTWGNVSLTAVKRAIVSKVSNELNDDSLINFMDNLASDIGYQLALREDAEFVNGDGTSAYGSVTGLVPALGAAGKQTGSGNLWSELTLEDFTDTMALLPSKHSRNAGWICSSNFYYSVMVSLLASAGGNTIVSLESGASRPTFLGKPVWLTDEMPTAEANSQTACLYGNYRNAVIIGDRVKTDVLISPHRYFEEDVTAIRVVARYDINVHEPGDGSNAGAYVGLVTAAS